MRVFVAFVFGVGFVLSQFSGTHLGFEAYETGDQARVTAGSGAGAAPMEALGTIAQRNFASIWCATSIECGAMTAQSLQADALREC